MVVGNCPSSCQISRTVILVFLEVRLISVALVIGPLVTRHLIGILIVISSLNRKLVSLLLLLLILICLRNLISFIVLIIDSREITSIFGAWFLRHKHLVLHLVHHVLLIDCILASRLELIVRLASVVLMQIERGLRLRGWQPV